MLSLVLIVSMPVGAEDRDQVGHGPDASAAQSEARGNPIPLRHQLAQRSDERLEVPAPLPADQLQCWPDGLPPDVVALDEALTALVALEDAA